MKEVTQSIAQLVLMIFQYVAVGSSINITFETEIAGKAVVKLGNVDPMLNQVLNAVLKKWCIAAVIQAEGEEDAIPITECFIRAEKKENGIFFNSNFTGPINDTNTKTVHAEPNVFSMS